MSTGLLIVDVQRGMFENASLPPLPQGREVIEKIQKLTARARSRSIPIIYVQHCGGIGHPLETGTDGWEIHPAIAPRTDDVVVQKATPDSFHNTNLKAELDSRNISRLVMAGLQTEYCIDTTCRRAFSLGYEVILAKDAHGTWSNDIVTAQQIIDHHNYVLGDWFVKLKETGEIDFVR